MHRVVRTLIAGILVLFGNVAMSQEEPGDVLPLLVLEPELDGSIWVNLYVPADPADPAAVSAALGRMMGESDPARVGEYYDGAEDGMASWSGYWENAFDPAWTLVSGDLEIEPVRGALRALGHAIFQVSVFTPPSFGGAAHWGAPVAASSVESGYLWSTVSLEKPVPRLTLDFRRTVASLAGFIVPVPLLLLLTFSAVALLRRGALQRPLAEAGYANLRCTQKYLYFMIAFWVLLGWCLNRWNPTEPLSLHHDWIATHQRALATALWVGIGTLASIATRVYLLPLHLRIPGASWTRRDFAAQAAWFSAFIGVMTIGINAASANLDGGMLRILSILFVAALCCAYCYIRLLLSLGFVVQSLDEGELRERVEAMAKSAGIEKLRGVYMLYRDKSPVLNALAANQMRVMFTDDLLKHLTRREIDTIIGHELAHLVRNHPVRLHRSRVFFALLGTMSGMVFGIFIGVALALAFQFSGDDIWVLSLSFGIGFGFVLGTLVHLRICRKFEYEADAGALALVNDPEAQIAGLARLTALNYMPLDWGGKWSERFLTHPSTRKRVECIAARGNVPMERLSALIGGEHAGEGHYAVPASAGPKRVFTTNFKTRVQLVNVLIVLLGAPLLPAAMAWASLHITAISLSGPAALVQMAASALATVVFLQNRAALRGFRGLAQRFRDKHGLPASAQESAPFVTFAPCEGRKLYDGFWNWDVGVLSLDGGHLHYFGDGTRFSVPRDSVREVGLARMRAGILPIVRILIRYTAPDGPEVTQCAVLGWAEASSLTAANRATRALLERIQAWHSGDDGIAPGPLPDTPYPPPGVLNIRGLDLGEVFRLQQLITVSALAALSGAAIGIAVGLPGEWPLHQSALGTGLATGIAVLLANLPVWLFGRRQTAGPPPS